MNGSEKNLLLRIKKGDREAFDMLFNEQFDSLCNGAFLIVRDESTAKEIVAEVFFRLWIKRNKININVSLKKYLYKCVYNTSMNYLKHEGIVKRHNDLSIDMHRKKEIYSGNYSTCPIAMLEYNELELHVNEAIDNLPAQCRKVFIMNRFKEMKYHEIAESLDISISTVKYHMSAALTTMREKLNGYLDH